MWVLLFLGFCIGINYTFDVEDSIIDKAPNDTLQFFGYLIQSCFVVFIPLLILKRFNKELKISSKAYAFLLFGLIIYSIDRSYFQTFYALINPSPKYYDKKYLFKVIGNGYAIISVLLPLLLFRWTLDRQSNNGLYGLKISGTDFKPYIIILLLMAPVIFISTYFNDIGNYYPTYQRAGIELFHKHHEISRGSAIALYESVYLSDFLWVELLHRGFLIIGLARLIGKDIVLPIVCLYASIHFGKPLAETLSSIIGGYLLCIMAFQSKNIWGGVLVHAGIAGYMELFSSIGK